LRLYQAERGHTGLKEAQKNDPYVPYVPFYGSLPFVGQSRFAQRDVIAGSSPRFGRVSHVGSNAG